MKRLVYIKCFIALFFFYENRILAQNLEYENKTRDDESCTYTDVHACVTIIAEKSLNLGFNSNCEHPQDILSTMEKVTIGDIIHYTLHFKTGIEIEYNRDYSKRILEISSSKYSMEPLKISLYNLQPKESHTYQVILKKCYELKFREGNTLFFAGKYPEAREKYVETQSCFDRHETSLVEGELEKKIIQIDSIIAWIEKAEESMLFLDYGTALNYYTKITIANPNDHHIANKRTFAAKKQNEHCIRCLKLAEQFYKDHIYDESKTVYERLIDQNCKNDSIYRIIIEDIQKRIKAQKNKYIAFTYMFGISKFKQPYLMLPIAFSIGKYPDFKVGGYFSFATNPAFFSMLRSDYPKAVQSNIGISFGLNFRLVRPQETKKATKYFPIWLYFGTGYSLMGAYLYKNTSGDEVRYLGGDLPDTNLKLVDYHAIPFETGLLIKIKMLAIRYTFQYRFAIDLDTQEYMSPYMHNFGIGVCF
jgi:tetratricopeptide (TPR) repeat protein